MDLRRWIASVGLGWLGACAAPHGDSPDGGVPVGDAAGAADAGIDASIGPGQAAVTLSPVWWERRVFGPTLVGATATATVTVTAHEAVTGLAPSVTRAGYAIERSDCPPALAAGASCELALRFTPLAQGSYDGDRNLVVTWTAATGDGEVDARLGGAGIVAAHAPGLVLAQAEVRVPPTVIGETRTIKVPVVNTASWLLGVGVAVSGDAKPFTIAVDPDCSGGVAPGGACDLDVTFAPTAWGCATAAFKVDYVDAWTLVRGCAARREERGRAMLDGIGRLVPDGDGFVFTAEPPQVYPFPGPTSGEVYRVRADGSFDPEFGDHGRLLIGTHAYGGQHLLALAPGHFLWFAAGTGGTDLALVSGGVAGDLVHVDGCTAVAAAVSGTGDIGLLCDTAAGVISLVQRHADLSEDVAFGRPAVLSLADGPEITPVSLAFDGPRGRWIALAFTYDNVHLGVRVGAVDLAGAPDPAFAHGALAWNYGFNDQAQMIVGADGALFVPGVLETGGKDVINVAKVAADGSLDPDFGGGAVVIPMDRSEEYVGRAPFVPLTPTGDDRVAFLAQLIRFGNGPYSTGSRWVAIGCDARGVCHQDERVAFNQGRPLPISVQDGERWLVSGWSGGGTFNWGYRTIAIEALRADGSLDPGFANRDDVTGQAPGGVAPWRMKADASGRFYVAAHDVLGQHRQPRVTRYDATGVIDPTFDFRLPVRAPEAVQFWDLFSGAWGESLNGRNLDLVVAPGGGGVLASFDGNARTVSLTAFTPAGALDPQFGDGGQRTFPFTLDADATNGGPFGINLVRVDDGSYWLSIDSSVGLVRHVSAQGAALGDWINPSIGSISVLLADGDDLLVFGQQGSVKLLASGGSSPIAAAVTANAVAAPARDGGFFVASPCVRRFTAEGVLADGVGRPLFGDAGTACVDGNPYDRARALVVRDDGSLDLYTGSHLIRLSADGQVLGEVPFAPDLLRDVAVTPGATLVVGRDEQSRLIVTSAP